MATALRGHSPAFLLTFFPLLLFLSRRCSSSAYLQVIAVMCVGPLGPPLINTPPPYPLNPYRLRPSGRAPHVAQPAAPVAQPAAVRALQEGAARRPQQAPPPAHHQRHGAGGAEQRHGKFPVIQPRIEGGADSTAHKVSQCVCVAFCHHFLERKIKRTRNGSAPEASAEILTPLAVRSTEHHPKKGPTKKGCNRSCCVCP